MLRMRSVARITEPRQQIFQGADFPVDITDDIHRPGSELTNEFHA